MGRWWGWEWSLLCQNAVFSLPRCLDSFGVSMSFIKKKRGKKKVRSLLTQAILQFCDSVILICMVLYTQYYLLLHVICKGGEKYTEKRKFSFGTQTNDYV